jgi:hypothetical protein
MQIVIPHYVSQRTEKGPGKGNNCLNDGAFAHPESSCPAKEKRRCPQLPGAGIPVLHGRATAVAAGAANQSTLQRK